MCERIREFRWRSELTLHISCSDPLRRTPRIRIFIAFAMLYIKKIINIRLHIVNPQTLYALYVRVLRILL